jgi:hypothetical protein
LTAIRSIEHSSSEHSITSLQQGPQTDRNQAFPLLQAAAGPAAEIRGAAGISVAFEKMNFMDFALIFGNSALYTLCRPFHGELQT